MTDLVHASTHYLKAEDLQGIAVYVKSVQPMGDNAKEPAKDPATYQALASGKATQPGAQLYLDNCAACQRSDCMG